MKARYSVSALALVALALAACSKQPASDDAAVGEATVHEVMTGEIDPIADEVWEIGNNAIGDHAGIDPALMTDESWARLADAAARLQAGASKLGALDPLTVDRPGVTIADEDVEGGTTSEQVQKNIDADAEGFRGMADALAVHMGDLVKAAKAKDADRAGQLINQLDGVCENCHLEFWYPQQKEMVEAILRGEDPSR